MTSPEEQRALSSASGARPVRAWRPEDRHARPGAAQRARRLKVFGVLALLVGIAGIMIWMFWPRSVPPVRFVGIGIGAYDQLPPNPGGRNDVVRLREHFELLSDQFPERFQPVPQLDDTLIRGPLLRQLTEQLADARDETLIVYCSTLAHVAQDGSVQLLAINADPDSLLRAGSTGSVSVQDILNVLSETHARRVLVFLDITRLDPHPRLGILARDVAAELAHNLEEQQELLLGRSSDSDRRPRITVVCGNAPGEFSWTMQDSGDEIRSVFGSMLQEAITHGRCDKSPADGVITSGELLAYLKENVQEWSSGHRAASQTLGVWGDQAEFDVMVVRRPNEEQSAEDDTSEETGDETGTDETASEDVAVDESREPAGEDRAADEPADDPAGPARITLADAWARRDVLARRIEDVLAGAPHAWRSLNARLLMAEQQQRAGYADAEQQSLQRAVDLFERIDEALQWNAVAADEAHWQLTLGLWRRIAGRRASALEDQQKFQQLLGMLAQQEAQSADTETPPVASGPAEDEDGPLSTSDGKYLFANWVIDQIVDRRESLALAKLAQALAQLDRSGMWPRSQWPAELIAAAEYARAAGQDPQSEVRWRELLGLVRDWYDVAGRLPLRPEAVALVQPKLDEAGQSLLAAERWLSGGATTDAQARESLKQAREAVSQARERAERIDAMMTLQQEIIARLPEISRTVAELAELDRSRPYYAENAVELGQRLAHNPPSRADELMQASLDLWPATGEDPQTRSEKQLLALVREIHATDKLWGEVLKGTDGDPERGLSRILESHGRLRSRWQTLQATRRDQQADLGRLRGPSLSDWLQVRALLNDPGWSAGQRGQLGRMLSDSLQRPFQAGGGDDAPSAPAGLWNGFWSIAMLQLAGVAPEDLDELWRKWEALIQEAQREDAREVLRRAELGYALNQAWGNLSSRVSRTDDPRLQEKLVRGLHGWDRVSAMTDADEVVRDQRRDGFSDLVGTYLNWWPYREANPGWASLRQRGQEVAAITRPASEPKLEELFPVECEADRRGELSVVWNPPDADTDVRIDMLTDSVRFLNDGKSVAFPDRPGSGDGTVRYEVELPASSEQGEQVTVVLTDARGFVYDLRRVEIIPPVDPSQWRIEFTTAQEGRRIRQIDFETERGIEQPGTRILLPPSGTVALQARLVVPGTEPAWNVEYECEALPAAGNPVTLIGRTPLDLSQAEIDPTDEQKRIALSLAVPEGDEDKDASPSPDAPETGGVDASGGLRFTFHADDKEEVYVVRPEFLRPDRYINRPVPTISDGQLQIPVTRRSIPDDDRDWLIAEQVPVTVDLSPVMQSVASGEGLLGTELPVGNTFPASLGFDDKELVAWEQKGQYGEFGITVGGWPYAYRWKIQNGLIQPIPDRQGSAVRFAEPVRDIVIERKQGEDAPDLPIRIEVYAPGLDAEWETQEQWQLKCDIRPLSGQRSWSNLQTWSLRASTVQSTHVKLVGEEWTFATSTRAFELQRPLELSNLGRTGRYELIARLSRGNEPQAEHRVQFAIDTTSPGVTAGAPPERHRYDRPLKVTFKATDRESGLFRLRIGLDRNGNGQLDDNEPQRRRQFDDVDGYQSEASFTVTFEPKELPQKAGTSSILMVATNRLGMDSELARHPVRLLAPPSTVTSDSGPAPPTTGTLRVTSTRKLSEVKIAGPKPQGPIKMSRNESQTFEDLPEGTYTIDWTAYNDSGSTKVKIKAGDSKSVTIGR